MIADKIVLEVIIDKVTNKRFKKIVGFEVTRNVDLAMAIAMLLDLHEEAKEQPDNVNNPAHYTQGGMECIEEMMLIFGPEETMSFCKLNAWKYRKRALHKGTAEMDMSKSDAYLRCYKSIKEKGVADFREGVKHD